MARKNPTPKQKERLFNANANRCCVCKEKNIGLQLHHIDGDNSNTVDENLALLCVKDHDNHHRPNHYINTKNCHNLNASDLLMYKNSWESFVKETETETENPNIIVTLNLFGDENIIHSAKLIMQWNQKNKIAYEKLFHMHSGTYKDWIDDILMEISDFNNNIKLVLIDKPLNVEFCDCKNSLSQTLDENISLRFTDKDWNKDSICTIYINPKQTSLAFHIFFKENIIFSGSLHLCENMYLHLETDSFNERILIKKQPSVRTQVTNIIENIIHTLEPAKMLIGTNNPDTPTIIEDFILPIIWENNTL